MNNSMEVLIKFVGDTKDVDQKAKSVTSSFGKMTSSFALGNLAAKGVAKAFQLISSNLDGAIARFDTMNNFPKVMSNLGISAEDAQASIDKMSDKLAGLPTTLDEGAMAVQRFTAKNGDLKKSTNIFLALNNAILAGGANTQIQSSALEQLSQAYAKGKPDMMEWRTIQMAMPAQLKQVAIAMGYAGGNADALGKDLREGTVSMDAFMEAVMNLNEKGIEGFQSFEEQARNSTAGIKTAIKVAKTQVVKGITNIMNGIDKGLKKSGTSMGKIISEFGKKFKQYLDDIAKGLSKVKWDKVFKNLVKVLKIAIPLLSSYTAGFMAYNAALKLIKLKGLITDILTLNTVMAANPLGLILTTIAAVSAGLFALSKVTASNVSETGRLAQGIRDYDKAMQEADETRQEYLDEHMNEVQNVQNLYNELRVLVDENGRVKEGYEDRVQYITGELSQALGEEIKLNEGVVEGYQNVKESIEKVIEAKRAKVLMDAQEAVYNKAKDQAIEREQAYADAQRESNRLSAEREEILKKIQKEYGLTATQLDQVNQSMKYLDENGHLVDITLDDLGQQLRTNDINLANSNQTLEEAGQRYYDNQQIIANYEQALVDLKNGNYDAVLKMYEDTTNYTGKTIEDTNAKYSSAIEVQKKYLEKLRNDRTEENAKVQDVLISAAEARIKTLEDEQKRENATVSTGQSNVKTTWNKALAEQLSDLSGQTIKFKKTADGHVQAYINGNKEGAPRSKAEMKKWGEDMIKELKKMNAQKAGEDTVGGFNLGFNSKKSSTFGIVANYGSSILDTLKRSLREKSPSKATAQMGEFFTEGFNEGIDDGTAASVRSIKNYGNTLTRAFQTNMPGLSMAGLNDVMQQGIANAFNIQPNLANNSSSYFNSKVNVQVYNNMELDPLGQVVSNIKTFSGGAKNDYNYGKGA